MKKTALKTAKTEVVKKTARTSVLVGRHWAKQGRWQDYRLIRLDKAQLETLMITAGEGREIFLNAFPDGNVTALSLV